MYLLSISLSATSQVPNLMSEMARPPGLVRVGGSGKDENLATRLCRDRSHRTEECHCPNPVRIVQGYQKETSLFLNKSPLALSVEVTEEGSALDEPP